MRRKNGKNLLHHFGDAELVLPALRGIGEGRLLSETAFRPGLIGAQGSARREGVSRGFDAVHIQLGELVNVGQNVAELLLVEGDLGLGEGETRQIGDVADVQFGHGKKRGRDSVPSSRPRRPGCKSGMPPSGTGMAHSNC